MSQTIPFTVFSENTESRRLAFSDQNPPIGNLKIRTQHWERKECVYNPIVGPGTEEECTYEPIQEDVDYGQKRTPLKM